MKRIGRSFDADAHHETSVETTAMCKSVLCQNCVIYPPKPPVNIVTYGRIVKYFVVAGTD